MSQPAPLQGLPLHLRRALEQLGLDGPGVKVEVIELRPDGSYSVRARGGLVDLLGARR